MENDEDVNARLFIFLDYPDFIKQLNVCNNVETINM